MTLREAMSARYEVRVWQWIAAQTMLLVLSFGAVIGGVSYVRDQRDAAAADVAQAAYLAEVAGYQQARDEHARCVGAVESRDNFRVALYQIEATFAGFVTSVELANPESPVLDGLRAEVAKFDALIEQDWAARRIEDCPPQPTPPTPPN